MTEAQKQALRSKPVWKLTPEERKWREDDSNKHGILKEAELSLGEAFGAKREKPEGLLAKYFVDVADIPSKAGDTVSSVHTFNKMFDWRPDASTFKGTGSEKYVGKSFRELHSFGGPKAVYPVLINWLKQNGSDPNEFLSDPRNAMMFLLPKEDKYRARLMDSVNTTLRNYQTTLKEGSTVSKRAANNVVMEGRFPTSSDGTVLGDITQTLEDINAGSADAYPMLEGKKEQAIETFKRPFDPVFEALYGLPQSQEHLGPRTEPVGLEKGLSEAAGFLPQFVMPSTQPGEGMNNVLTGLNAPVQTPLKALKFLTKGSKAKPFIDALASKPQSEPLMSVSTTVDDLLKGLSKTFDESLTKGPKGEELAKKLVEAGTTSLNTGGKIPPFLNNPLFKKEFQGKVFFDNLDQLVKDGFLTPDQAAHYGSLNNEARQAAKQAGVYGDATIQATPDGVRMEAPSTGKGPVSKPKLVDQPQTKVQTPEEARAEALKVQGGGIWDSPVPPQTAPLQGVKDAVRKTLDVIPGAPRMNDPKALLPPPEAAAVPGGIKSKLKPAFAEPAPEIPTSKSVAPGGEIWQTQPAAGGEEIARAAAAKATPAAEAAKAQAPAASAADEALLAQEKERLAAEKAGLGVDTAEATPEMGKLRKGLNAAGKAAIVPASIYTGLQLQQALSDPSSRTPKGPPPAGNKGSVLTDYQKFLNANPNEAERIDIRSRDPNFAASANWDEALAEEAANNAPQVQLNSLYAPKSEVPMWEHTNRNIPYADPTGSVPVAGGRLPGEVAPEKPNPYIQQLVRLADAASVGFETYNTGEDARRPWKDLQNRTDAERKQVSQERLAEIRQLYDLEKSIVDEKNLRTRTLSPGERESLGIRSLTANANQNSALINAWKEATKPTAQVNPKTGKIEMMANPITYPDWLRQNGFQ